MARPLSSGWAERSELDHRPDQGPATLHPGCAFCRRLEAGGWICLRVQPRSMLSLPVPALDRGLSGLPGTAGGSRLQSPRSWPRHLQEPPSCV